MQMNLLRSQTSLPLLQKMKLLAQSYLPRLQNCLLLRLSLTLLERRSLLRLRSYLPLMLS